MWHVLKNLHSCRSCIFVIGCNCKAEQHRIYSCQLIIGRLVVWRNCSMSQSLSFAKVNQSLFCGVRKLSLESLQVMSKNIKLTNVCLCPDPEINWPCVQRLIGAQPEVPPAENPDRSCSRWKQPSRKRTIKPAGGFKSWISSSSRGSTRSTSGKTSSPCHFPSRHFFSH